MKADVEKQILEILVGHRCDAQILYEVTMVMLQDRCQPPDLSTPQHLWTDEEYRIAAARQQAVVSRGHPAPTAEVTIQKAVQP
jgi:hypothetical protein